METRNGETRSRVVGAERLACGLRDSDGRVSCGPRMPSFYWAFVELASYFLFFFPEFLTASIKDIPKKSVIKDGHNY